MTRNDTHRQAAPPAAVNGSALPGQGWEAIWRARLDEVDGQIISFMEEASEKSPESLAQLSAQIADWFESQQLPELASAEWKKVRADGKVLQSRIEKRIAHLVADGRLKLNRWKNLQRG